MWRWPTNASRVAGRTRSASGAVSGRRSLAASLKRSPMREKYAPAVTRHEETGLEDEFAPILPGPGGSDYERYLRTDELLSLQKGEEERAHHDELLFQVVHQSSELWLKLAWNEVEQATERLEQGEIAPALRLLRRSALCLRLVTD